MAKKNQNVRPYYDDFDASKNYQKILFKPSFSVQARELTQLQTILGDQIQKVSDPLLDNGDYLVPGELTYMDDINYVKLSTTSSGFNANVTLANLPGTVITDGTLKAKVISVEDTTTSDQLTLYVTYLNGSTSDVAYAASDSLTTETGSYTVGTVSSSGTGSAVQVKTGTYYINGMAVQSADQTLILDKYSTTPSYRIGFTVSEIFADSSVDTTLNDNSSGTANHLAPGADRYKVSLTLAKRSLTSTTSVNNNGFVEICRVVSGKLQEESREIDNLVTERRYGERDSEENGNYVTDEFDIEIREHSDAETDANGIVGVNSGGNSSQLAFGISEGKAVINGTEVEVKDKQYLAVDKTRGTTDKVDIASTSVPANIQNFQPAQLTGNSNKKSSALIGLSAPAHSQFRRFGFLFGTTDNDGGSNPKRFNVNWTPSYTDGRDIIQFADTDRSIDPYKKVFLAQYKDVQETNLKAVDDNDVTSSSASGPNCVVIGSARVRDIRRNSLANVQFHLFDIQPYISSDGIPYDIDTADALCVDSAGRKVVCHLDSFRLQKGGQSVSVFDIGFDGITKAQGLSVTNIRRTQTYQPAGGFLTASTPANQIISKEVDDNGTVKESSRENILVFGPGKANGENIMWTSDSLYINFNAANSVQIRPYLGDAAPDGIQRWALGAFGAPSATTTTLINGVKDGDVFRVYHKDDENTKAYHGALIQAGNMTDTTGTGGASSLNYTDESDGTSGNSPCPDTDFKIIYPGALRGVGGAFGTWSSTEYKIEKVYSTATNAIEWTNAQFSAAQFQASTDYDVIYNVDKQITNPDSVVTKTLQKATKPFTGSNAVESILELDHIDIVSKKGKLIVKMANDYTITDFSSGTTDITDWYELDTGQRDEFYGLGKLKLKSGYSPPSGNVNVEYWHFIHDSAGAGGHFFTVKSYPDLGAAYTDPNSVSYGTFNLDDIPSFTSSGGKLYRLGDCVDFRSSKSKTASVTYSGAEDHFDMNDTTLKANFIELPSQDSVISIGIGGTEQSSTNSIQAYGSRIDKVYLDQEGSLGIQKGTPFIHVPVVPNDPEDSIVLFNTRLKPFIYDTNDVYLERTQNKKYTLSDIKNIEQRLEEIERFSVLSPLEQEAVNYQVPGFTTNGFWVDPFMGHDTGDKSNENYDCAVDYRNRELRPSVYSADLGFSVDSSVSSDLNTSGNLITLGKSSDETEYVNLQTNSSENVRTSGTGTYHGYLHISPWADRWKSLTSKPDLLYDTDGIFDNIKELSGSKANMSVWNDWQTFWAGTNKNPPMEIRDDKTFRTSGTSSYDPETQFSIVKNTVANNKEVARNYIPYIRSKTITLTAYGLKPNSEITSVKFDGREIKSDISVSGDYVSSSKPKTDTNGKFVATYVIPNNDESVGSTKFRTGKKVVKIVGTGMECQGVYDVSGCISNTGTTLAYEEASLTQTKEVMGQEIVVENDCFISKVDLYFKSEDAYNRPVIVQLRTIKNDKISREILPYSTKILTATDISTTAATTVTFDEYIYLKKGRYALTLHSPSDDYSIYSLQVDQQAGSRPRNVGRLFKGTSIYRNRILKFQMYRVKFNTSASTPAAALKSDTLADRVLPPLSVWMNHENGKNQIKIVQDGHGYQVGNVLQLNGFTGTATQVLDMGSDAGALSFVNGLSLGDMVADNAGTGSALDARYTRTKWGFVIAKDTSDSSQYTVTVANGGGSVFVDTDILYLVSSGASYNVDSIVGSNGAACNGVPIADLNNKYFKVVKADVSRYVVEKVTDDTGNTNDDFTTYGFTRWLPGETGITVKSSQMRADMVYYLVEQIQPNGTGIVIKSDSSNGFGSAVNVTPNANNYLSSSLYISGNHYLQTTLSSTDDRVSPVIDTNTVNAILITNRVNQPSPTDYALVELERLSFAYLVLRNTLTDPETTVLLDEPIWWIEGFHTDHGPNSGADTHKSSTDTLNGLEVGQLIHLDVSENRTISSGTLGAANTTHTFVTSGDKVLKVIGKSISTTGNKTKVYVSNLDGTTIDYKHRTSDDDGYGAVDLAVPLSVVGGFVPETDPGKSSSVSNYVSSRVQMANSSRYVKVMFDTKIPTENKIEVYMKSAQASPDGDVSNPESVGFDSLEWVKVPFTNYDGYAYSMVPILDDGEWHEVEYLSTKVSYFNQFQIKIVFTGTRTLEVPRIKNLKVFALL